jgi:hypothetical protein
VAVVEYVMVPVPEELAAKVLSYVSWRDAQANAGPPGGGDTGALDHTEAIARAFARLDADSRALVGAVATAALEKEELSIPEAARRARVTTREALGIFLEVNNIIVGEGAPPLNFRGGVPAGAPPGRFTWDNHLVAMPKAIVGPIADLARAGESS